MKDFYESSFPEPFTILGVRLLPLSLGHLILMTRLEVSFITGNMPTLSDLALGVFICSRSYEETVEAIVTGQLDGIMKAWAKKLTKVPWLPIKRNPGLMFEKFRLFAEYINQGFKSPEFISKESDSESPLGECPLVQIIKVKLMKEFGLSDSEIMNRSWSICLWDYITLSAMENAVSIVEPGVLDEALKRANELAEKLRANAKA